RPGLLPVAPEGPGTGGAARVVPRPRVLDGQDVAARLPVDPCIALGLTALDLAAIGVTTPVDGPLDGEVGSKQRFGIDRCVDHRDFAFSCHTHQFGGNPAAFDLVATDAGHLGIKLIPATVFAATEHVKGLAR